VKHRNHMILGGIAVLVAVMLLGGGGANPLAAGIGLAFLICPIVMGIVMWLLMRKPSSPISPSEHHMIHEPHDDAVRSGHP
jgi:hypothetical protein